MAGTPGLISSNGIRIALASVHIEGEIDGTLANITLEQRYRNDSGKKLEIVYTFPLAWGATLLDMEVTLGDRRLKATVIGKKRAWQRYENAIERGDAPIIVERTGSSLYTANLGNIENGENVVVKLRYAQLLSFEGSQLRLGIPCVIAPRYGDAYGNGGLAPHETDAASLTAEYPLTVRISLPGKMADARIRCPSHDFCVKKTESGVVVLVESGAMLDRDFILLLEGMERRSFALVAPDADDYMVMACFHPSLERTKPETQGESTRRKLQLKILVDCSASMAGDGIAHAKQALISLVRLLEEGDCVSLSRFGDLVDHQLDCQPIHSREARDALVRLIEDIGADMGGTRMNRALLSTFRTVSMPECCDSTPSVLLITDGAVWGMEEIIRVSRDSGQRIFSIGVGGAPAESLLRELAEETGGACELVSPNENMTGVVMRMVERMRGTRAELAHIDWSLKPIWQSTLPAASFDGDIVYAFASFAEAPERPPVLHWRMNSEERHISADAIRRIDGDTVARLGGAKRMAQVVTPDEARALALRYQLVGQHTALFLVHDREGEKSAGLPVLHQVPQMLAAGYAGFGSVREARIRDNINMERHPESFFGKMLNIHLDSMSRGRASDHEDIDRDNDRPIIFSRPGPYCSCPRTVTPLLLLQKFEQSSRSRLGFRRTMQMTVGTSGIPYLDHIVANIGKELSLTQYQVWAVLLEWLSERLRRSFTLSSYALRLLSDQIATVPDMAKTGIIAIVEEKFPRVGPDIWE